MTRPCEEQPWRKGTSRRPLCQRSRTAEEGESRATSGALDDPPGRSSAPAALPRHRGTGTSAPGWPRRPAPHRPRPGLPRVRREASAAGPEPAGPRAPAAEGAAVPRPPLPAAGLDPRPHNALTWYANFIAAASRGPPRSLCACPPARSKHFRVGPRPRATAPHAARRSGAASSAVPGCGPAPRAAPRRPRHHPTPRPKAEPEATGPESPPRSPVPEPRTGAGLGRIPGRLQSSGAWAGLGLSSRRTVHALRRARKSDPVLF